MNDRITPAPNHNQRPTCRQCVFWGRIGRPPGPAGAAILGQPEQGECQAMPPQLVMFPDGTLRSLYPQTHDGWPCCGQFKPIPTSPIPNASAN